MNTGAIIILAKNNNATTREVKPVLPPSSIPLALSIYVVTVLVPRSAPNVVPSASVSSTSPILSTLPSLLTYPAKLASPVAVPRVSKKSTTKKVNTITVAVNSPRSSSPWRSIFMKSEKSGEATMLLGGLASPATIPVTIAITIDMSRAPGILRDKRIAASNVYESAISVGVLWNAAGSIESAIR